MDKDNMIIEEGMTMYGKNKQPFIVKRADENKIIAVKKRKTAQKSVLRRFWDDTDCEVWYTLAMIIFFIGTAAGGMLVLNNKNDNVAIVIILVAIVLATTALTALCLFKADI